MARHYQRDYIYGVQQQSNIHNTLKEYFRSDTFKSTKGQYCKYDFEDDNCIFELKSRKCNKNLYDTTLLTCNKIINTSKHQIFIFNFKDEICYLKYDEEIFKTFEKKLYSRTNDDSLMLEYFFVPLANLTTIKKKIE